MTFHFTEGETGSQTEEGHLLTLSIRSKSQVSRANVGATVPFAFFVPACRHLSLKGPPGDTLPRACCRLLSSSLPSLGESGELLATHTQHRLCFLETGRSASPDLADIFSEPWALA